MFNFVKWKHYKNIKSKVIEKIAKNIFKEYTFFENWKWKIILS